ncbi:MAG: ATP synthase F0 subunit A, partial [Flavobacteriaceae bacterium]|nr:ATP synthase F0 subunit A [Flavobacteriaceae bacterium]
MVLFNKPLRFIAAILIAGLPLFSFSNTRETAQPTHEKHEVAAAESNKVDEKEAIKEQIEEVKAHHVLDGHDFSLFEYDGQPIGFSLPIILWDNGIQFFSSSKFNHGETVAESKGNFYKLHHEKIYKTDASGALTEDEHHHPTNAQPLDFSVTKGVLTIMIVALLMFLLFTSLAKSYAKNGGVSSGAGRFFEPIVLYIRDE